jgi:hypothetical protein
MCYYEFSCFPIHFMKCLLEDHEHLSPVGKEYYMRKFGITCFMLALFASPIFGQDATSAVKPANAENVAPPGVSQEVWAYIQEMKRTDDPKQNARRVAQFKAQQRQARLATQQWFGYSNLRPIASPMPFTGNYSPMWVGNTNNDYHWANGGYGTPSTYVEQNYYQR